jgi:hypothetical protein
MTFVKGVFLKPQLLFLSMLAYLEFLCSKHQYTRQFRTWRLKKNSTEDTWKFVSRRLEKRKLEGRDQSEVEINDILIPEKKVRKEISRHVPTRSWFVDDPGKPHNTVS